jgi:hypothetical protein
MNDALSSLSCNLVLTLTTATVCGLLTRSQQPSTLIQTWATDIILTYVLWQKQRKREKDAKNISIIVYFTA